MFRPWGQDARPAWRAQVDHEVLRPLDAAGCAAAERQVLATGLARHPAIRMVGPHVRADLLVKAATAAEAAVVAGRVVEAVHREAGTDLLGPLAAVSARRHPDVAPPR